MDDIDKGGSPEQALDEGRRLSVAGDEAGELARRAYARGEVSVPETVAVEKALMYGAEEAAKALAFTRVLMDGLSGAHRLTAQEMAEAEEDARRTCVGLQAELDEQAIQIRRVVGQLDITGWGLRERVAEWQQEHAIKPPEPDDS